jgi:hypothetical protein
MTIARWIVGVGILAAAVIGGAIGCSKKAEPAKTPPPGVTKEMEQIKPPAVDMGTPSSSPAPGSLPAPTEKK